MLKSLSQLRGCTRAATAVEYGLILAMVFLAMVVSVQGVAGSANKMWNNVSTKTGAVL